MANVCGLCGKGSDFGNLVSHAKNRTKTIRKPNLHSAKILLDGKKVKMRLCTKCIRRADRPHKMKAEEKVEKKVVDKVEKKTKKSRAKTSTKKTKKDTKK